MKTLNKNSQAFKIYQKTVNDTAEANKNKNFLVDFTKMKFRDEKDFMFKTKEELEQKLKESRLKPAWTENRYLRP